MKKYEVTEEKLIVLGNYLKKQPWEEVAHLIQIYSALPEILEPKATPEVEA